MDNTIENPYGEPAIILLVVGILSSALMFTFMFKYVPVKEIYKGQF